MLMHKSQYYIHVQLTMEIVYAHCMAQGFMHILLLNRILRVIYHSEYDMNAIF